MESITNPDPYQASCELFETSLAIHERRRMRSLYRILRQFGRECLGLLLSLPLAYGIVWELRTALPRIQLLRKYRFDQRLDPSPEMGADPTGSPVYCTRRHTRIVDMQTLRTMWPWASPIEQIILLEGWDMGADWAFRTQCIGDGVRKSWLHKCTGDCARPNRLLHSS
jgi:hypothetical protein